MFDPESLPSGSNMCAAMRRLAHSGAGAKEAVASEEPIGTRTVVAAVMLTVRTVSTVAVGSVPLPNNLRCHRTETWLAGDRRDDDLELARIQRHRLTGPTDIEGNTGLRINLLVHGLLALRVGAEELHLHFVLLLQSRQ